MHDHLRTTRDVARREMFVIETQIAALASLSAKRCREEAAVEEDQVQQAPAAKKAKKSHRMSSQKSEAKLDAAGKTRHKDKARAAAMVPDTLQLPLFLEIRVHGLKHYIPTDPLKAPSLWAVLLDVEVAASAYRTKKNKIRRADCWFFFLACFVDQIQTTWPRQI